MISLIFGHSLDAALALASGHSIVHEWRSLRSRSWHVQRRQLPSFEWRVWL